MKTLKLGLFLLSILLTVAIPVMSQSSSIDTQKAAEIFRETKLLCQEDNGFLWGRSLDVPLLFVDTNNRNIVANVPDKKGLLKAQNGVFIGQLPQTIHTLKGLIRLGGKRYAIMPWPLPENKMDRKTLIIHEAFHCLQPELDLEPLPYNNGHMDKMEARVWLKLEWQALEEAVRSEGPYRKKAIEDALLFRQYRRALFSACDGCENRFEIHEGMAEYTAQKICRTEQELKTYLLQSLKDMWGKDSFVNCFAYCSGPLYGYLLDSAGHDWRTNLGAKDDLAEIAQIAFDITLPSDLYMEAEERSVEYRGALIMGEELDREIKL